VWGGGGECVRRKRQSRRHAWNGLHLGAMEKNLKSVLHGSNEILQNHSKERKGGGGPKVNSLQPLLPVARANSAQYSNYYCTMRLIFLIVDGDTLDLSPPTVETEKKVARTKTKKEIDQLEPKEGQISSVNQEGHWVRTRNEHARSSPPHGRGGKTMLQKREKSWVPSPH